MIILNAHLLQNLEIQLAAAFRALGLANKLGCKKHKSRIFSMMNKIRAEIRHTKKKPLLLNVFYRGGVAIV